MKDERVEYSSPSQRRASDGSKPRLVTGLRSYRNGSMGLNSPFPSGNQVVPLRTAQEVLDSWPFFLEGLVELQKGFQWRLIVSEITFLKIILRVLEGGEKNGTVCIIKSKSGKNVGFFIVQDNTEEFAGQRTALCYALYSVGNDAAITRNALEYGLRWCKENGYGAVYAMSLRTGSAVRRLFEKKWGFHLYGLMFRKTIV